MNAHEQHRVVSLSARPSPWPLVEQPWLRASKDVQDATLSISTSALQRAAEPIGKLGDEELLARAGVPLASNCANDMAPIQYP